MCGICGIVSAPSNSREVLRRTILRMSDTLSHRGPDGDGAWLDEVAGVGLGHRRLAVIDPSPAGRQPMISADGRYVLTYNGEIYNHRELRSVLEATGARFRGGSDTEVLLEACARWGLEATAARLVGMFAFGLWDRAERVLRLVRDQLGVKPLYWCPIGGGLLFGSELKALAAHPSWRPAIDRDALPRISDMAMFRRRARSTATSTS
jgi:asparagine synthase (glutamine-hydrolysing)